ncbi:hypothetical protein K449DRAFT_48218 [Hypoxylon sp. EC38]|nr:hypothetical protein K449DRAFT_48218 [Hypoxylon sp. EC38]
MIQVYYLDEDNFIRERSWDPIQEWTDGPLDKCKIKAASFSQLTATSWGNGNIILYYQDEDGTVRILHGWIPRSEWRRGPRLRAVPIGSPLAATNFEHLGNRELRLYCKFEDSKFGELCCDRVEDEEREKSDYYEGGYAPDAASDAFIAATSSKQADLEMFIYHSSKVDGIVENKYSGGRVESHSPVGTGEPTGPISTLRSGNGSVLVYFIEGNKLMEVVRVDGNWSQTVIMSGASCHGTECPRRIKSEKQQESSITGSPAETSGQNSSSPEASTSRTQLLALSPHKSVLKEQPPETKPGPSNATQYSSAEPSKTKPEQQPPESLEIAHTSRSLLRSLCSLVCVVFRRR